MDSAVPVGPKGRAFVAIWALGLTACWALTGYLTVRFVSRVRAESIARHRRQIDPERASNDAAEKGALPVRVGVYVDRVADFSIKQVGWSVEFFAWFHWTDDSLHPGDDLRVVNGQIETKDKLAAEHGRGRHYELYRVTARITKYFDVRRFPCDDHLLTVDLEDSVHPAERLRFVPDEPNCAVSSRVGLPGYQITRSAPGVQPHAYRTTRGDPNLPDGAKAVYSQFTYGIWITRPTFGLYLKLFQGLFAATAVGLLASFIKPIDLDPRFGLGVGAFFAAVANNYITTSLLPDTGVATLTDIVNGVGMGTIFLTLVQSTISLYLYERRGQVELSRLFDRVTFGVALVGYVAVNVAIPWAALV
jgi:hypothetical protein